MATPDSFLGDAFVRVACFSSAWLETTVSLTTGVSATGAETVSSCCGLGAT